LLHALWPCGQGWQTPPLHIAVPPHASPQPPQLAGSVLVSVQLPLHSVAMPEQAWQLPLTQDWPVAQALPQPPQLFGSS
jgi:hypothetical protein